MANLIMLKNGKIVQRYFEITGVKILNFRKMPLKFNVVTNFEVMTNENIEVEIEYTRNHTELWG